MLRTASTTKLGVLYDHRPHDASCMRPPLRCFLISLCFLEFDQYGKVQPILVSTKVRGKTRDQRPRRASVATRRSDSVFPRKIRNTGSPMVKLPAESDVLAGHVIEGCRCVP